jgi:hypothetical protein
MKHRYARLAGVSLFLFAAACGEAPTAPVTPEPQSATPLFSSSGNLCEPGTWSETGEAPCFVAEPGFYASGDGATSQELCPKGQYADEEGLASCKKAMPGHFVHLVGAAAQLQCPVGTFQPNEGAESCLSAEPGHFVDVDGAAEQQQCPAGSFQPDAGQNSCILAKPGYFAEGPGAEHAVPCQPGSYAKDSGQASCTLADYGYFVDKIAALEQTACPAGTTTLKPGATSEDDCKPPAPIDPLAAYDELISLAAGVPKVPRGEVTKLESARKQYPKTAPLCKALDSFIKYVNNQAGKKNGLAAADAAMLLHAAHSAKGSLGCS